MFTSIERRDQDAIVKFVFQKQREFSQKGVA
jgi:c-di-GMP-binding flagellar brake protein YcgR